MAANRLGVARGGRRVGPVRHAAPFRSLPGLSEQVVLSAAPCHAYDLCVDGINLPPELERFAAEAIAAGRYRDVAEVVAAGVNLLRRQEAARADLLASVTGAEEEADRVGYLTADEMIARVEARLTQRASAKV
jgi:putative addiction module CopG family antidote